MREIKFSCMWSDGKSWMDLKHTLAELENGEHWDAMSDMPLLIKFKLKHKRQFTGLKDKNGKEIYEGDLLNVFFTSNNGEHIHDCIYKVEIDCLSGITLKYVNLLWESFGYNQCPVQTTLCGSYRTLREDYVNGNYDKIAVQDTTGESHILGNTWKESDYSNNIEIIGNIYENPELLTV